MCVSICGTLAYPLGLCDGFGSLCKKISQHVLTCYALLPSIAKHLGVCEIYCILKAKKKTKQNRVPILFKILVCFLCYNSCLNNVLIIYYDAGVHIHWYNMYYCDLSQVCVWEAETRNSLKPIPVTFSIIVTECTTDT